MNPVLNALSTLFTPSDHTWERSTIGWALFDPNGDRITPVFDNGFLRGEFTVLRNGRFRTAEENLRRELQFIVNKEPWYE